MRVFKPAEEFRVKTRKGDRAVDYHMERKHGSNEWIKVPARLSVMIGYREKNYDDIDNLLSDINECIPENRDVLKERIIRLKHKLYGIKYHIENFVSEENKVIEKYHNEYRAPATDTFYHNPGLIYECPKSLLTEVIRKDLPLIKLYNGYILTTTDVRPQAR